MKLEQLIAALQGLKAKYSIPPETLVYVNDSEEGLSEVQLVEFRASNNGVETFQVIIHSEDSE